MVKKIEIENFRGYKNTFIFDLSETKQYGFNKKLVKNGIVKNALIFGKNGCGKSNLLLAFMELSNVLTDYNREIVADNIYFYAASNNKIARFKFHFQFGKKMLFMNGGNIVGIRFHMKKFLLIT